MAPGVEDAYWPLSLCQLHVSRTDDLRDKAMIDHDAIAECVWIWYQTHDEEKTREYHERVCVPWEKAMKAHRWAVLTRMREKLDREANEP